MGKVNNAKIKPSRIKKVLAKTGSYDLTTSINSSDLSQVNDKIRLNSAEPIRSNNEDEGDDTLRQNSGHGNNKFVIDGDLPVKFPKKKTCFGLPLTCFAYFAAAYSILAYGASSLLSIFELMTIDSPILIPLYILLIGYLLITLITFVLIVALQREMLNFVLLWCIVMGVLILPEIGLNIMLAQNTFNWFETTSGFYNLVALVVRVTLDVPAIATVLVYHHGRVKRAAFLRKFMMPLRHNISSGEIVRSCNRVVDEKERKRSRSVILPPPIPSRRDSKKSDKSSEIGFEKILNSPEFPDRCDEENEEEKPMMNNRVEYKFPSNIKDYEIIVRPSKDGKFRQQFVNIDEVKLNRKDKIKKDEQALHHHHHHHPPRHHRNHHHYQDHHHHHHHRHTNRSQPNKIVETNRQQYLLNDTEFKERYINEIAEKSRIFNLANHHIYLPPVVTSSSSLLIDQKRSSSSNFVPLNPDTSIDRTHEISIDTNGDDAAPALLNVSNSCQCVNIAACDEKDAKEFLHSDECPMKSGGGGGDGVVVPPSLLMFTQRKHF